MSLTTHTFAQSDPKFLYLPEPQALAMQRAIESGARLTPYDKQFLFWMALNLVNCGFIDDRGSHDLGPLLEEAASSSLLTDPFASVQAQIDFPKHALTLVGSNNPCNSDKGEEFLVEIVNVLVEDNIGSRSDFGNTLENLGILPNTDEEDESKREIKIVSLHKARVLPLGWYNVDLLCKAGASDGTEQVCGKISELIESGSARTIECVYGPSAQDGTGFQAYEFWFETTPGDLGTYEISGLFHPFHSMGSAAVTECPSDTAAAMRFHTENPL